MKDLDLPKNREKGKTKETKMCSSYDLRYANVIKKRKRERLQKIVKKIIFGKDIEESEISTSLL